MAAYIGKPGALLKLKSSSELQAERGARAQVERTLGGRSIELRGPRLRRVWVVEVSSGRPEQYAELEQLIAGAFGDPPYVWLDEYAQVTNLLTPDASLLKPGTYSASIQQGGQGKTADGVRFGYSILPAGVSAALGGCAVVQGVPVMASIYCTAGRVRLDWIDASGTVTNGPVSAVASGTLARVSITAAPPATAVRCRIVVADSTQAALPALTFTSELMPWATGRGCEKAGISELSEQVQMAVPKVGFRRAQYSHTVYELG